jgi:zinc transporter ZupT
MSQLILNAAFLILSVIAGGLLVIFLERKNQQQLIKLSLAFSGGFLLAIAFIHFLPELYHDHTTKIGFWILLGFLVQLFLEYFSGGIEHGHIHVHSDHKIPYTLLFSLSVHSFIEGIPLAGFSEHVHEGHHHESLLLGIVLHQFPVAIALMTLLRKTNLSMKVCWILLAVFGMMTPMGMFLGWAMESGGEFEYMDLLLAIVVGMFLHISTTIIFETSENHKFNLAKLMAILMGVALTFLMV